MFGVFDFELHACGGLQACTLSFFHGWTPSPPPPPFKKKKKKVVEVFDGFSNKRWIVHDVWELFHKLGHACTTSYLITTCTSGYKLATKQCLWNRSFRMWYWKKGRFRWISQWKDSSSSISLKRWLTVGGLITSFVYSQCFVTWNAIASPTATMRSRHSYW